MEKYDFDGYGGPLSWTAGYPVEDWCLLPDLIDLKDIPKKFDLREKNAVSPVKDKGRKPEGIGICWLFSAIASLESHLLLTQKASDQDLLYIQSELHGAYSTFDLSDKKNDPYENPRGRKPGNNSGKPAYSGTRYMAVNYLTRDAGTTPQILDPYYKEDMIDQVLVKRKWDITENKPGKYYVKKVLYLPDPVPPGQDPNFVLLVKNYVMQYGGVTCSIFWQDKFLNDAEIGEDAYYDYTSGSNSNHAVTIVGWDDNYPVDNFNNKNASGKRPDNPGAFLVKNCWKNIRGGEFVWVSYECANFGTRAYCVADVGTDYYGNTVKIYQHDNYGYNDFYIPYSDGTSKTAKAQNTFDVVTGDKLIGISFYACSACYVTLRCSEQTAAIVEKYACLAPGYYTYELKDPIALNLKTFSVTVEYESATNLPAYIPLEVNDNSDKYNHWDIKDSKSSVYRAADDTWVPVSKLINPTANNKYGYFCMKAIVKNESENALAIKKVYDELQGPAADSGYTMPLPDEKDGIPLEWRLEPYHAADYSKTYQSTVSMFEVNNGGKISQGLVNTGTEKAGAYLVAIIGSGSDCMRKILFVDMGTVSEQYGEFTCGEVEQYDCKTTLQGKFPIPGAVVSVMANGETSKTTVNEDGTWKLEDFALYNYNEGWKDEYTNTTVTVEVLSTDGLTLTKGGCCIELKPPYDQDGDKCNVFTVIGLIAAGAAAVAGFVTTINLCADVICQGGGAEAFLAGCAGMIFNGNGHTITTAPGRTCFGRLLRAIRIRLHYQRIPEQRTGEQADLPVKKMDETLQWGGIAKTVSKGGSITDCTVTGSIDELGKFGGLFYEGEDVTVQDCTVDLAVNGGSGTYAGVAVNLSGSNNSIAGTTVTGTVNAAKVAGLVQTMEGGRVEKSGVSLNVEAESSFAGILETGNGVEISDTVITATGIVSNGKAAGGILSMNGGSIKNCRISAVLSGSAGAFGIAGAMDSGARIENCYSACKLTATEAEAAVCGIAEGIKDSPDSISGCVSVGSYFSADRAARVSLYPVDNCVAYDSMTCKKSFIDAKETLKSCNEFFAKSLYEALKWDFTVWSMEEKQCFPLIQGGKVAQTYDYPFLYPQPPESGKFEYTVGQVVAIMGFKDKRVDGLTWSLSPHLKTTKIASGDCEFLEKENEFYFQIAALAEVGDYDLTLTSLIGEQRYDITVLLHII